MSKIGIIFHAIERDKDLAIPKTSDRKLQLTKGSAQLIRHQFIDAVNNYLNKKSEIEANELIKNLKKYKQIIDKVKNKFDELYVEISDVIYEMEERIYQMAKEDYALEQGIEDFDEIEEIDNYDIPDEIINSFIKGEWHHNIESRYDWARDYFPMSGSIEIEKQDPWNSFVSRYVDEIQREIENTYKDYIDIEKRVKNNIKKNNVNIFDYIFEKTHALNWDYIRSN